MILFIDNYDSFTYNLVQYLGSLQPNLEVVRNDRITLKEIEEKNPTHIILSPGPGYPKDAGICEEVIRHFQGKIPILGICLGHQAICEVYGGEIAPASHLMHGKTSQIFPKGVSPLFEGIDGAFRGARYHSLALKRETLPDCLRVTALAEDGEVMAVEHRDYPVYGLQFHPESILTEQGMKFLENFLKIQGRKERTLMIKEAIHTLMDGKDLDYGTAKAVMEEMMEGRATQAQMGAFLAALRMQGESIDEITAFAEVMREKGVKIRPQREVMDIVGTGGDGKNTFNISTAACFTVAGAGFPVVKHGNYGATSVSGASNVMEQHGVKFTDHTDRLRRSMEKCNIAYLHAPLFNPALKAVAPIRKALAVRTFFNMLGPLVNPVIPTYQLLGVYNLPLLRLYRHSQLENCL